MEKLTPSKSRSAFSFANINSFRQELQKPFEFLNCTNSVSLMHALQKAFGQQKHRNFELFWQVKHVCQPIINEINATINHFNTTHAPSASNTIKNTIFWRIIFFFVVGPAWTQMISTHLESHMLLPWGSGNCDKIILLRQFYTIDFSNCLWFFHS